MEPSQCTSHGLVTGHVWTAQLDLPVDEFIQFKLILREPNGQILWQPGPNRILHTWKTSNTIKVLGDWETASVHHVTEEHHIHHQQSDDLACFNSQRMFMDGYLTNNFQSGNVVAKEEGEIDVTNKVLVPAIIPCINVAPEDVTALDERVNISNNCSKPKLDQKQEEESKRYHKAKKVVMFSKLHAQIQHPNKQVFANSDEPKQRVELPYIRDWNNQRNGILHSSIKWGQQNVRVLLIKLGFGFIFRAMK